MKLIEQKTDSEKNAEALLVERMGVSEDHPVIRQDKIDANVRLFNPLDADELLQLLTEANELGDTVSICKIGIELIKRANQLLLHACEYEESLAMLRDLGMVAASLARFNLPVDAVPRLEQVLLKLGKETDEVPRDTVFSYGPRNPQQKGRVRTFTQTEEELIFITAFSDGMRHLGTVIIALERALSSSDSNEIIDSLRTATIFFNTMTEAIVKVRRQIPPEVFTHQLRPFFNPVTVGGKPYLAPGGAQMPVILIDKMVWGLGRDNPEFDAYFQENLGYHPKGYREYWQQLSMDHTQNLIDKLILLTNQPDIGGQYTEALEELLVFITSLIKFRTPHLKVARDNFRLRDGGDLGSGGYQPTILEQLLEVTRAARSQVQSAL